ncbi:PepSY domain-containing protein [Actinokineospora auranticolor]|uniref:Putative iron-regulated membrane protein n=1 Tax=Actinokineospora auranticolor TaxID=155976 RepID=A0A2S6GTX5_9PSEU|nr:PepSY domain-containing protein [Actinokineospora auranticolor]PPK68571.1 putative iron-regulated membrane protein [Actinokineospora auranticolor]
MSAPPLDDVKPEEAQARVRWSVVPLLRRLHFYAGVFVAPFLVVAALSGMLYAFSPQLDDLLYGDVLYVEETAGAPRPLAEQVAAAQSAVPAGSAVTTVGVPEAADEATRVVFSVPGLPEEHSRTVYVNPYTAGVQGQLTTWFGATPVTTWLDGFHRDLRLGETGALYSEMAASWLWVISLAGVVLWLVRRRKARGPRTGVRRTRARHGKLGAWTLVGALFLSATGLTWSTYAGENFSAALEALHAKAPVLDTALPGGASTGSTGHHGGSATGSAADPATFDRVLVTARTAGLDGPLEIGAASGKAWTAAQVDNTWPVRLDKVAVDPASARVTARADFDDRPLLAKLTTLGIQAHMGRLFGIVNQIALLLVAGAILTLIFLGYRMWWQRRPTRGDRRAPVGVAPRRGAWQQLPLWFLVPAPLVVIAVGWAIPLLGISLAAFLVLDGLIGLRRARATT